MKQSTKLFIFFLIIFILFASWMIHVFRSGAVERYVDEHPGSMTPAIDYYEGMGLSLSGRLDAAVRFLRKVYYKFPKSDYAPLAWAETIDILDRKNDVAETVREANNFLKEYPNHPKAEFVRRKIYLLKNAN